MGPGDLSVSVRECLMFLNDASINWSGALASLSLVAVLVIAVYAVDVWQSRGRDR
jgi:hypothetical protein